MNYDKLLIALKLGLVNTIIAMDSDLDSCNSEGDYDSIKNGYLEDIRIIQESMEELEGSK